MQALENVTFNGKSLIVERSADNAYGYNFVCKRTMTPRARASTPRRSWRASRSNGRCPARCSGLQCWQPQRWRTSRRATWDRCMPSNKESRAAVPRCAAQSNPPLLLLLPSLYNECSVRLCVAGGGKGEGGGQAGPRETTGGEDGEGNRARAQGGRTPGQHGHKKAQAWPVDCGCTAGCQSGHRGSQSSGVRRAAVTHGCDRTFGPARGSLGAVLKTQDPGSWPGQRPW
eukprot:3853205-Prymnesium_polylepis.1